MTGCASSAPVAVPLIRTGAPASALVIASSPAIVPMVMLGAVVSTCSVPAGLGSTPFMSLTLPAASLITAEFRLKAVACRSAEFSPAAVV